MQGPKHTPPNHVISLNEHIQCFELAGHEFCQNLAGIAVDGKIVLGLIRFPEETEDGQFQWQQLKEIAHETRCHAISFAPDTSLVVLPKVVKFCAAGADFHLRIYRSSLTDRDTVLQVKGHTGYVNDVAWDPASRYLASVSDDHTCIVWTDRDDCETRSVFRLRSAGMSVRWHPEEPEKLLVAEKRGVVYVFNVLSQQTVVSVETPRAPLRCADWSAQNRWHIVALAGGDVIVWNIQRRKPQTLQQQQQYFIGVSGAGGAMLGGGGHRPLEVRAIHEDGGQAVRFAPGSDSVVASVGRPGSVLKVTHMNSTVPLVEASLKLFGGLGWHYRLPYVAAASDRKLCFWKVVGK